MAETGERAGREGNNRRGIPLTSDYGEAPTLSDLGIDHNQSSNWQRVAALPEEVFEARLDGQREARP
jgi:hypothetical protein